MRTRYDHDLGSLEALLDGQPRYRARQLHEGLYRRLVGPEQITTLPKAMRAELAARLPLALGEVTESTSDGGGTVKWLWELPGGARIETVLMHHRSWSTVCVSTQAGCAMACGFCATGQAGFERHLTVGEIVEQVVRAAQRSGRDGRRLSNVVFMGMGEPLANYGATWGAVRRLHDALGIGARHLTISTVGVVPGIRRMSGEDLPVNLAVSLHAADDRVRDELVPLNRRYPLAVLMAACSDYLSVTGRRVSFEWALIDEVNDGPEAARDLARLARSLPIAAHVNLIPLNPTHGYAVRGSPPERIREFRDRLDALGVRATVRRTRGTEIDAACGQLRAEHRAQPIALRGR